MSEENESEEDILPRRAAFRSPSQQITALLVGQTRLEGKVDNLLERFEKVEVLEEKVDDHEVRLIKLEANQGFQGVILNAAWALALAIVAAGGFWFGVTS